MLIDDDKMILEYYGAVMEGMGVVGVYSFSCPLQAMEHFHDHTLPVPDLVLCDYHMPNLNGREFVNMARSTRASLRTKFAIITGSDVPSDVFHDVTVLRKPLRLRDFRAYLESVRSEVYGRMQAPVCS